VERFNNIRPFGMLFVEHKDVWGLKMRAAVGNVFNSKDHTVSVNYQARRDGPVEYMRDSTVTWHPFFQFTLSGTF
jgi:outer membrane receptor for ferrienterochelin and colicins